MDWALFSTAFLSATLLPGGSEALLLLRLKSADADPLQLVLVATAGNLLGSLVTFGIGRLGNHALHLHRWLRVDDASLRRAEHWFGRWGHPTLLFAWLPVVGDPLCLLAGLLRVGLIPFVVLVGIGKLTRYALLAALAS